MSGVVTITRLPETIQGLQIAGPQDMLTILQAAAGYGYTGEITQYHDADTQAVTYRLRVNNLAAGDQFAHVGDWVILWNNKLVTTMTPEAFAAKYTAAP